MDPELYKLIQQAVSDGITSTQIMSGVIALFAAGLGAWIGSYFSKRGEFAAFKKDIDDRLALEFQKTRGVERQELRYKSYGTLWKELRPLAIYDASVINKKVVGELSRDLSNWYFSENGGLLLTPQAREFYFALQNLLRNTFSIANKWKVDRSEVSEGKQKEILREVLIRFADDKYEESLEKPSDVLKYFEDADFEYWQEIAPTKGRTWRKGINYVAEEWDKLNNEQRFAILQQAGSILRTSLTIDLESRLR